MLLICAILDDAQLAAYRQLCDQLRLSALVEAHAAKEIELAVACGARVIGVNNRDLKTFDVDMNAARALRDLVPPPHAVRVRRRYRNAGRRRGGPSHAR